jgi:DNA-binding response OmpR family regulator
MTSLAALRVLVVANAPALRSQLRNLLTSFGVEAIQSAISATSAVRHLRQQHYDLILCDHDLGDGQDGQHLLEDLRQHEIIPPDTLFVIITGERNYERVVGTAELAPDDYILIPLVPGIFHNRLTRVADKREALLPAWRLMAIGDWLGAIDYCRRAENDYPACLIDLLRLRAELHCTAGQLGEAEATYREILSSLRSPWAKLGLARSLALKKQYADADTLLTELIADNDQFMAAYDLLAQVRADSGQEHAACEVLKTAAEHSPWRLGRQRRLGELALAAGDAATAEIALGKVLQQSAGSAFRDPEDHVRLIQAQLAQDKPDAAQATLDALEKELGGQPKAELCRALAGALLHVHTGDNDQARTDLAAAARLANPLTPGAATLSTGLAQELIKTCFDQQLGEMGAELVTNILRTSGDERTLASTRALLQIRGMAALSQQIEQRIQTEVRELVAAGVERARAGDHDGALAAMMDAARKMPGHPVVLFNAALALLRHIEHKGWNNAFARQARALIERARVLAPASERLAALAEFMHLLIERDNVLATTPPATRA